jgi:hypothetical protein
MCAYMGEEEINHKFGFAHIEFKVLWRYPNTFISGRHLDRWD